MCGITGIVGPGAESNGAVLSEMSQTIAHRGPDGQGSWFDHDVAFAHRRLSIIDRSSAGHQPMKSDCGRFVIIFNGEIYNYVELRDELESRGERFLTQSDTEVLLTAYRRWGGDALTRLNGMWAFAIWDRRERCLVASRDRFGKKPFYYVQLKERFYFASEIKALLRVPGMRTRVREAAIADFAAERITDHTEDTFYGDIKQLPAAGCLTWKDGRADVTRFWRLRPALASEERPASSAEILSLATDAVRLRLRADTPVGCLLSGGLDSSAIASIMAREVAPDQQLHAFSTFNVPPVEESLGVGDVFERYPRFHAHTNTPSGKTFWNDLPAIIWHQEEPFADASMAAHFSLMRESRHAGVPVLLTGQGADEVFGGYESSLFAYLGSLFRGGHVAQGLQAASARRALAPLPISNLIFHSMPLGISRRGKNVVLSRQLDWLSPDFSSSSPKIHFMPTAGVGFINDYLRECIEVRTLPGFLHYEDRNSMAFGVETRLPFLDFRLVERVFGAQAAQRYSKGQTKALLRDAVEGIVPSRIVKRVAKQGYPAPLGKWLRQLEGQIRLLLAEPDVRCNPIIKWSRWHDRVNRFFRGDDAQLTMVWRGLALIIWYRRFVNGKAELPCA